jgi:dTDP-glucose 4,6-dehydratase
VHILQAGVEVGVRHVVLASTSEVYGTAQFTPITEQHPLVGQSPYAASKIAAEKMAESFARSFRLPITILRPFNTFGERQSARAFIPGVIAQALYRGRVSVGSLDPQRDLNYVSDIVDGFLRACCIQQPSGEVYNIGSGIMRSMRQVIGEILGLLRMECPVEEEPRRLRPAESEVWRLQASAEKARLELGWSPSYDFRQGLQNTIEFVRAHPEVYADLAYPL